MARKNVVGAQVRKAREERNWTQEVLAARCNVQGWDISRGTLAKIEAEVRRVTDAELFILAKVLGVEIASLYPSKARIVSDLLRSQS